MNDAEFLAHIVIEICNYAVENQMEPDDTLKTVAENILSILTISTYNNWKRHDKCRSNPSDDR